MGTAEQRDKLLKQIRALPLEDRDYIEAALMREAYEYGRSIAHSEDIDEIERRALNALRSRTSCCSHDESVARALAAVEAIRSRKR